MIITNQNESHGHVSVLGTAHHYSNSKNTVRQRKTISSEYLNKPLDKLSFIQLHQCCVFLHTVYFADSRDTEESVTALRPR